MSLLTACGGKDAAQTDVVNNETADAVEADVTDNETEDAAQPEADEAQPETGIEQGTFGM